MGIIKTVKSHPVEGPYNQTKYTAKAKEDMPTGRSSAASGAYKKKEAAERKKYVQGKVKSGPSGSR